MSQSPPASPPERGNRLEPSRFHRLYWHLRSLRREVQRVIQTHIAGRGYERLIDYGCGNMPYRPLFVEHVRTYSGCDLGGNPLAELELESAGRIPLPEHSVDVVLSSQVLEHVSDPRLYLAECRRTLRAGGKLILSTHGVWRYHPDPVDYWRWTSAGLKRVIEESGFKVIEMRGVMGPSAYAFQILQDATYERLPRFMRGAYFGMMQLAMQVADGCTLQQTRDRDACVFMVVAE